MRNLLLALCFFAFVFPIHSVPTKFYNVNSLYGISMRGVTSICKDSKGFIWASSKMGVLRHSGDDNRIYKLPYQNIDLYRVKLVYSNRKLLAYTNNNQVFEYNEKKDRFELLFDLAKVLRKKYLSLYHIQIDDAGCYWMSTSLGLYRYQKKQISVIQANKETYSSVLWKSHSMFVADSEGIWVLDTYRMVRRKLLKSSPKSFMTVLTLFYDDKFKRLWIGSLSNGLFYFDMKSHRLFSVQDFPKQPILAIETNSDSSILVGVDGQGVWKLNRTSNKILDIYKENEDDHSSLRGNGVYDIFNDQNKRIWVCTYSGGLSFFDNASPLVEQITHSINNPNSLGNNNVNKIIQDKRGNIWFATNNGISCKESGTGKWKRFYNDNQRKAQVFLSLCEDDKGRIWAGTYSSGIYVIDELSGRELAHYSKESTEFSFSGSFIFEIYKDSQGDLWFGGVRGNIVCYLSKENRFREFEPKSINAFAELSPGKLLLACSNGLALLDKNSGRVTTLLDKHTVLDIAVIKDEIWLCTSGEGLIKYNYRTRKMQRISVESGLPSDYVNSIMFANRYLWLGTEKGLCRLDPNSLEVLSYNTIYPLSQVAFNLNSHCRLNNGRLIWGTNNGAVSFSTNTLTDMAPQGSIFFQDFTVAGHSIREELNTSLDSLQNLSLNYTQNALNLELLALGDISGPKFSWMLEGFEDTWGQPTENRFINYSNIPDGDYVLKIRLYDSSLSQIIAERSLKLTIVPPFWKTWWFELFLVAFILVIIYLSLNYYIQRLKQRHTEEKIRFFTNTAHDIRTSLTLIKAPIEELAKEGNLSTVGRRYLSLATEQARRLSTVVTQLMDFQKMDIGKEQLVLRKVDIVALIEHRMAMFESLAKSKNVVLQFDSNQKYYPVAVDESMVDRVIDNLISNAIKYSRTDSLVEIKLKFNPENWTFEVRDHGIGISKKAQHQLFREFYRGENAINSKIVGSGIGLLLVKNYVTMHGGEISCESQESVGSAFKIIIPYKEISEEENGSGVDENTVEAVSYVPFESLAEEPVFSETPKLQMNILIVEDNDDLIEFLKSSLQSDFEVLIAKDGDEAWEIIRKQMPDLVVSDVMMPNKDGFELCRLMKSTYETSHVPIILLTALAGRAEQLHGLGLGADDYLTKPFDMSLLAQKIKSVVRNRQAVREKALKLIKVSDNQNEQILTNELNDKFVKKMLEVVRKNIENAEFGKDEFAVAMNVSGSLLYKKVKALTDQSPTDFIKIVRLDYALELLQSRKYNVTEVSELCGFSSISYFGKVFKKHFGKSPTEI